MKHQLHQAGAAGEPIADDVLRNLTAFHVTPEVRSLVTAACAQVRVTSQLKDQYVSLSPQSGGRVASYVHRERLTVALSPGRADAVRREHGWAVKPRSGVTSYVQIPADALASEAQRSVALSLLIEAIRWRNVWS